jgi:hypothetical protein
MKTSAALALIALATGFAMNASAESYVCHGESPFKVEVTGKVAQIGSSIYALNVSLSNSNNIAGINKAKGSNQISIQKQPNRIKLQVFQISPNVKVGAIPLAEAICDSAQ